MKMKKYWKPRFFGHTEMYVVKVSQLRLELGCFGPKVGAANHKMAIQIMGTTMKKGKISPSTSKTLLANSTHTTSPQTFLISKAPYITWDARDLYGFHLILKHGSMTSMCHMGLHVLHGEGDVGEYKSKMDVVGKVSMSVTTAELMVGEQMKTESNSCQVQRTLPIQLKIHGLSMEATLLVSLGLMKLRNFHDDYLPRSVENIVESEKKQGTKVRVYSKKNNVKVDQVEQSSPYESDDSAVFDSDDSSDESTTTTSSGSGSSTGIHCIGSSVTNESDKGSDTETYLDTLFHRSWSMLPWNRSFNGWSFKTKTTTKKQDTLTSHLSHSMKLDEVSTTPFFLCNKYNASGWENKELWSRDGKAKLKTNMFFASFDQRSKQASGESACAALVVFIAHWLHSNKDMPTRAQFDSLIKKGSSEWRRLCHNDHYLKLFPNKHFDLETILEANIRPLVVLPQNSYTGFFSPEKFECLEGAMSFDEIWDEITRDNVVDYEPRIHIVSWNDHFFVLKVEEDACYVIDTLGERLFEGCQKAFILKFDGSSLMDARVDKAKEDISKGSEEERVEVVFSGKECCKEFIKQFLAAIPLRQLEEEEKNKGTVSNPYFHRQLQIDFHFSLLSSLSSASSSINGPL